MKTIKTIKELFEDANKITKESNEPGMAMVPAILNFGFFPGGYGIYKEEGATYSEKETLKGKNIMILGQDWGTLANYEKDKIKWEEDRKKSATWRNLINLLDDCKIDKEKCFFTNAFMGLRKDAIQKNGKKVTNTTPLKVNNDFKTECQNFFKKQVSASDFKLVLAMGTEVAHFIANIPDYSKEFEAWKNMKKIIDLYDSKNNHIIAYNNIVFQFITHTSLNKSNLAQRYKDKVKGYGYELEKKYVTEAFEKAFKN